MSILKPETRSTWIQIFITLLVIATGLFSWFAKDWLGKTSAIQSNKEEIQQLQDDRRRIDRRMERLEERVERLYYLWRYPSTPNFRDPEFQRERGSPPPYRPPRGDF